MMASPLFMNCRNVLRSWEVPVVMTASLGAWRKTMNYKCSLAARFSSLCQSAHCLRGRALFLPGSASQQLGEPTPEIVDILFSVTHNRRQPEGISQYQRRFRHIPRVLSVSSKYVEHFCGVTYPESTACDHNRQTDSFRPSTKAPNRSFSKLTPYQTLG